MKVLFNIVAVLLVWQITSPARPRTSLAKARDFCSRPRPRTQNLSSRTSHAKDQCQRQQHCQSVNSANVKHGPKVAYSRSWTSCQNVTSSSQICRWSESRDQLLLVCVVATLQRRSLLPRQRRSSPRQPHQQWFRSCDWPRQLCEIHATHLHSTINADTQSYHAMMQ